MRRAPALVLAAVLALPLGGCGNEPTAPPPITTPDLETALVPIRLDEHDWVFLRPESWRFVPGATPLVGTMSSGLTTIALWRYERSEPLPETPEELEVAKDALVAAAQARDPTLRVILAKGTRAARSPAVVIVADETVAGQPRRVRSTHIYANASEYVVDAFAPPEQYEQVEDPIFRQVVRQMRVGPAAG